MSEEIFALATGVVALVGTMVFAAAGIYVSLKITGWIHSQRIYKQEDK